MKNPSRKGKILLLAALLCAAFSLGLAACGEESGGSNEHVHEVTSWETVKEATCTEEGQKTGVCTVCQETVTETISKIPHTYESVKTIKEATCTEGGLEEVKCSVCGFDSTRKTDPAHKWKRIGINKTPDCENDGEIVVQCTVCSTEETQVWKALGHSWVNGVVTEAPTCTAAGSQHRKCSRAGCGKEEDVAIQPLGHDWESDYTVDAKPTFEKAGSRSVHCTRCTATKDVTVMPQLGSEAYPYRFRLTRSNGLLMTASGIKYVIKNEDGEEMGKGTFRNGSIAAFLPPQKYTVELTDLPEGYVAETSYQTGYDDFAPDGSLLCDIAIKGSVISEEASPSTTYGVGSVMHDFTYTDVVTGEELKLSELLETKKAVILNFWYVGCVYCGYEFPELQALSREYGDDLAIISVNASARLAAIGQMGQADSKTSIMRFVSDNGYTFHFVEDPSGGEELSWKFGVKGTPVNYFIDREGVVCTIVDGYLEGRNEERLKTAIEQTMSIADAADPSATSLEALPPDKRK